MRQALFARLTPVALRSIVPGGGLVVLSVIDNLVKGAVGHAIQSMNLMFGLEETAGLCLRPPLP